MVKSWELEACVMGIAADEERVGAGSYNHAHGIQPSLKEERRPEICWTLMSESERSCWQRLNGDVGGTEVC